MVNKSLIQQYLPHFNCITIKSKIVQLLGACWNHLQGMAQHFVIVYLQKPLRDSIHLDN